MSGHDVPKWGKAPPHPQPPRRGKGWGKRSVFFEDEEDRPFHGPAAVEDEFGLESTLVHVIGIDREWLWSGVVPDHFRMDEVQTVFQLSDRRRFGLVDGSWYKLVWDCKWVGPLPEAYARRTGADTHLNSLYRLKMDVASAVAVIRSPDTKEMWVTAIKVLVI